MSGSLPLDETLIKAEAIYRQLTACKLIPASIMDVIQINNAHSTSSSASSSPEKTSKRTAPQQSGPIPGPGRRAPDQPVRVANGSATIQL